MASPHRSAARTTTPVPDRFRPRVAGHATVVVLPTYNERENIGTLLPQIVAHGPEWHVLVVDDASPDGTGEAADAMAAEEPRIMVLHRAGPKGLGLAYREGLDLALRAGFEYIFTMDSDLSHDPRALPALRDLARERGAAVGSRYVRGGGATDWCCMRRLNSYAVNLLTRLILGLRVRDASTGFRCFRRDVLERVEPVTMTGRGYSIMEELSYRTERVGCRSGEHPIIFVGRKMGVSKTSIRQGLGVLEMLLRLRFGADSRR